MQPTSEALPSISQRQRSLPAHSVAGAVSPLALTLPEPSWLHKPSLLPAILELGPLRAGTESTLYGLYNR